MELTRQDLRGDLAALAIGQCLNSATLTNKVFKEFDRMCHNMRTELCVLLEHLDIPERNVHTIVKAETNHTL